MTDTEQNEKLRWPPTKGDLEKLYLEQRLSAAKIAGVYGLKYASPKTAESTVLYHLKRNGIKRRDPAEHIRKVTDEMARDWVRRYEAGESLKQIAGGEVSPVTVFNHLHKEGIQPRDKIAALMGRITRHPKSPFSGDPHEKAYLMGFAQGDLYVTRHGRAVRVKTSTTHPAMAKLFEELFKKHGPVYKYPREAKWTGFEWSLDADLDSSFAFLLETWPTGVRAFSKGRGTFLSFLSGFFDAEGSIYLHAKTSRYAPELVITNTNYSLIQSLAEELRIIGFNCVTERSHQKAGRSGILTSGEIWKIRIWRFNDVQKLLRELPLRHAEKVEKARFALDITQPLSSARSMQVVKRWDDYRAKLKEERGQFLYEARRILSGKSTNLAEQD